MEPMYSNYILSENYVDFLLSNTPDSSLDDLLVATNIPFMLINRLFKVAWFPLEQLPENLLDGVLYTSLPKLYIPQSTAALDSAGILQVQERPTLGMTGNGVIIGIIDSGINYTHPAFRRSDGGSRILFLWDQTIQPGDYPEAAGTSNPLFSYGTIYTQADIDRALASEDPFSVVPSRDDTGHGTAVAGVAAGSPDTGADFSGVAPEASLVVIKLKPAKQYLIRQACLSPSVPVYEETDILCAISWMEDISFRRKMPLALCLSCQSWQGSHNGDSALEQTVQLLSSLPGLTLTTGTGNEADKAHHASGEFKNNREDSVEILVPEDSKAFSAEIWCPPVALLSAGIQAPSGDRVANIPARLGTQENLEFLLDRTTVEVNYEIIRGEGGNQMIYLRFLTPSPGIWRLNLTASGTSDSFFHLWLPAYGTLDADVRLLSPDPFTTVMGPGNCIHCFTVAANNTVNTATEGFSGRGYNFRNLVTPSIAAPGANLTAPSYIEGYRVFTGASASAALTAGCSALVLEWARSFTPPKNYGQSEIRTFLLRGADRPSGESFPNPFSGYGNLNLEQSFLSFFA